MLPECLGELLGTMILIILGNGVVANCFLQKSKGYQSGWMTITTGWFVAVLIGVLTAQSTGSLAGDINPAVSFSKYLLHQYTLTKTLYFSLSQILGAFIGAIVVWLCYFPHWQATDNAEYKLITFCTKPAIRAYPYNLLCEIIATFVLVFGIAVIFGEATANGTIAGFGPYLVGVLVWGIGLSLGGPTGFAINPARDLGPRIAHALLPIPGKGHSDWSYAWVPILGPLLGAVLAIVIWNSIV